MSGEPEGPQAADAGEPQEPALSAAVRRFLVSNGVREHNHASEIARIIDVDRSQAYRRLKGDVAWNHADLRAVALRFGAPQDHLLAGPSPLRETTPVRLPAGEAVPAKIHVRHLPSQGLLVPGAPLRTGDSSDLVAVRVPSGWAVYVDGDEPPGSPRHAVDMLSLRSHPRIQVALLDRDIDAAAALVEAFAPLGIAVTPFADNVSLRAALTSRHFDACVLDWMPHDGATLQAVQAIRRHRARIPVIVVTGTIAADSEMEKTLLELSTQWSFSTLDKSVRTMHLANALKQLVAIARA